MKGIITFITALIMSAGLLTGVAAQTSVQPLTLEKVREAALANSKTLQSYNIKVEVSALDERTQLFAGLPSLSASVNAGATLWNGSQNGQGGQAPSFADSLSAGASVGISQSLWDGGKNGISRQLKALQSDSAKQDALAEYYAVLESADAAYYNVLKAEAALAAAQSSLQTAQLSLSTAEVRYQNKMINDSEYLQARAEMETRENSFNQAERDLALSKLKLARLTGIADAGALSPIDFDALSPLIEKTAGLDAAALDALYAELWKKAQAQNPGIVRQGLSLSTAEKNAALAAREYSPTLSISVSTGIQYNKEGFALQNGAVSLSGRIPLDIWVTAANVEKQKLNAQSAGAVYQNALTNLEIELETALLDLVSQAQTVQSSSRALLYAEKRLEYTLELYTLSRASPSELSDAESQEHSTRNTLNNARYAFLQALSKLRGLCAFESESEVLGLIG